MAAYAWRGQRKRRDRRRAGGKGTMDQPGEAVRGRRGQREEGRKRVWGQERERKGRARRSARWRRRAVGRGKTVEKRTTATWAGSSRCLPSRTGSERDRLRHSRDATVTANPSANPSINLLAPDGPPLRLLSLKASEPPTTTQSQLPPHRVLPRESQCSRARPLASRGNPPHSAPNARAHV